MTDLVFWTALKENDYAVPEGHSLTDLTETLLMYLGSLDGDERDGIGYEVFAQWIVSKPKYAPDQLRAMRDKLLDNLEIGLGEREGDRVFLRSFSILVLGLIVYRDNNEPFLASDEIHDLLEKSLAYFTAERDMRGYVDGKGWAHSSAHAADTLKFLIRNRHTTSEDHVRVLDALAGKLMTPTDMIYMFDEDERLGYVVIEVLKRDLVETTSLTAWVDRFVEWRAGGRPGDFDTTRYATFQNIKHFLRSLYFQLMKGDMSNEKLSRLSGKVFEALKHYNR